MFLNVIHSPFHWFGSHSRYIFSCYRFFPLQYSYIYPCPSSCLCLSTCHCICLHVLQPGDLFPILQYLLPERRNLGYPVLVSLLPSFLLSLSLPVSVYLSPSWEIIFLFFTACSLSVEISDIPVRVSLSYRLSCCPCLSTCHCLPVLQPGDCFPILQNLLPKRRNLGFQFNILLLDLHHMLGKRNQQY